MNSDRIKEIQQTTAYPDSVSVKQALLQVWNECEQQQVKTIPAVMKKVKVTQDDSGHWYIIPNELFENFHNDLENEELTDSGEFDTIYGQYRTGGDLNNEQLYIVDTTE